MAEGDNITWDDVPNSSFIARVTHSAAPNVLYVELVNGSVYAYDGAGDDLYTGLLDADWPGTFFAQNVRARPARQLAQKHRGG